MHFFFLRSILWFHILKIAGICVAVMGMALVVHTKISQVLLPGKKTKIKTFFLRDSKKFHVSVGRKSYICLESDKHVHVDFNSTVNMDLEASVCSLAIFFVCSFFLFSFFFLSITQCFSLA